MIKELTKFNRSYRKFYENEQISDDKLLELIDLARLSPSPRNIQAFRFAVSNNAEMNDEIFTTLAWAGYLKDWDGPVAGERPSAYIIILGDKKIVPDFSDTFLNMGVGIVAQSILLGAAEIGFGGCMIGSIQRPKLQNILQLEERYEIRLVIALGKPKETVVLEEINQSGDVRYWRDEQHVHHVPKRKLEDLVLFIKKT